MEYTAAQEWKYASFALLLLVFVQMQAFIKPFATTIDNVLESLSLLSLLMLSIILTSTQPPYTTPVEAILSTIVVISCASIVTSFIYLKLTAKKRAAHTLATKQNASLEGPASTSSAAEQPLSPDRASVTLKPAPVLGFPALATPSPAPAGTPLTSIELSPVAPQDPQAKPVRLELNTVTH